MVGRYDILFPLASGGMASVYVGRLSGMAGFQRLVAIKVIHAHLAGEAAFVKMFLDEARLAAGIHHPNVGEIMEVGEDDGILFMVGELVMGQSLAEIYRRAGQNGVKIADDISAWIVSRVCLGLHAAHMLQDHTGAPLEIVHRDVSPRNILVSYDGFVKLIDFGVAHAHGRLSHTDAGTLKGKIGYMPPEQIMGETVDLKGDVFSLGVVLYRMATGRVPFQGKSDGERIHKILKGDFASPRKVSPQLDPDLETIILRAMAREPAERYQSAAEMNADLEGFLRSRSATVGTLQMSELMKSLFEEDIFEFQYRLQTAKVEVSERGEGVGIPVRDKSVVAKSEPPTAAGTPSAIEHGTIGGHRKKPVAGLIIGIGVAAIAVVGVGWLVLSGMATEKDPEPVAASGDPLTRSEAGPATPTEPAPVEMEKKPGPQAEAEPAVARIRLDVSPEEAWIRVDGEVVSERLLTLPADGEEHEVEASAKGYAPMTMSFVSAGDRTLEVSLKKLRKKAGRKQGGKKKGSLKLKESPYG